MGKKKYIETPDKMYDLFNEYRNHVKDNPRKKVDFKGKDAERVIYDLEVPLTMEGFENFVFEKGVINDLGDYFSNKNGKYEEYSTICSRIKKIIRQDQIEGGMVNIYNPSITQRLNGLVDKKETTLDVTEFYIGGDEED